MKKNSKYRQGIFVPQNIDKFIGERAVYRSGLELKFFRFCDMNPKIVRWGSENIKIPYHNPLTNRTHRYHIDNYVVIREGELITKYCVEIKPYSQTQRPTTKYRNNLHLIYDQKQYVINQAKWAAAKKYCAERDYSFLILTEKELS